MNSSNSRQRKPILLYCSTPTQTHDSDSPASHPILSEAELEGSDSDIYYFPPCRIGTSPPLISRSPGFRSSRYRRSASGSKSPPKMGLGQTNILNTVTVNKNATNLHMNLKVRLLYSLVRSITNVTVNISPVLC